MTNSKQIIQGAITRIKRGWTKGRASSDIAGFRVPPSSPSAVCWCLTGALAAEIGFGRDINFNTKKIANLAGFANGTKLVEFNDNPDTTKQDVIEVLERALDAS